MIDPGKLLGGLLGGSGGLGDLGSLGQTAKNALPGGVLGMGLLGVAMAALFLAATLVMRATSSRMVAMSSSRASRLPAAMGNPWKW